MLPISCANALKNMGKVAANAPVRNYTQLIEMSQFTIITELFSEDCLNAYSAWNLGKSIKPEWDKHFSPERGGEQGNYRKGMQDKIIVSRAFAPIDKTLFLLSDIISTKTKIFFLKGRAAKQEINNAKTFWNKNKQNSKNDILINFETYSSLSNKDSFIVKCTFQEEKNNGKKTKNNICI